MPHSMLLPYLHYTCNATSTVIRPAVHATTVIIGLSHSSTLSLFRGITRTKQGERLRASGSLSYTRMRELFLAKLKDLGVDSSKFGLHSLRVGGASAAANAGVADRLFKRHGRWRSES